MFGFINLNKPAGSSSRDAVNLIQKHVRPHRVGHAGTLDPIATGVLVVAVGPATRLTRLVQAMPKTYVANFRLGVVSETEDVEGELVSVDGAPKISESDLTAVLPEFVGTISQMPPKFSALKVNGRRAYSLARKGEDVKLKPREIEIFSMELLTFDYPNFQVLIRCGSGTYVRSIGRDIGERLDSGAVMTGLQRTAIGEFSVDNGVVPIDLTLAKIEQSLVKPQVGISDMPRVEVPNEQVDKFADGHAWNCEASFVPEEAFAIDERDRLLTILKKRSPGIYTPAVNFSKYWIGIDGKK